MFLFSFNFVFSQEEIYEEKKAGLFFSIGTEYKITPITDFVEEAQDFQPINIDLQNSGVGFFYTLQYQFKNNLSLGFSNTFRYDYIFEAPPNPDNFITVSLSEKSLITDFHFFVDYYFSLDKKREIGIRAGRSLLNRDTHYNLTIPIRNNEGTIIGHNSQTLDSAFGSWNFGIGLKQKRFQIQTGILTSSNTNYNKVESIILPYIRLSYNLIKLVP